MIALQHIDARIRTKLIPEEEGPQSTETVPGSHWYENHILPHPSPANPAQQCNYQRSTRGDAKNRKPESDLWLFSSMMPFAEGGTIIKKNFFFLAMLHSMWDPTSPTRDGTHAPCSGSVTGGAHWTIQEVPGASFIRLKGMGVHEAGVTTVLWDSRLVGVNTHRSREVSDSSTRNLKGVFTITFRGSKEVLSLFL